MGISGTHARTHPLTRTLLNSARAEIYAPDKTSFDTINHTNGEAAPPTQLRNVLVESARIARGKIARLQDLKPEKYSAVIFPGGELPLSALRGTAHSPTSWTKASGLRRISATLQHRGPT
jgi:enhancing lycopene biosynthesis protein 2